MYEFLHSVGNDSRHDVPHLIHWIVFGFLGGDARFTALCCVAFTSASVAALLTLLRRSAPGGSAWRWLVGWLGAFHLLSPFQWMNMTWGVQTCYTGAVFGTLMVVMVVSGEGSSMRRTALASVFAAFGCLSYMHTWLAWGLIGLHLVADGWQQRKAVLGLLLSLLSLTAAYFLMGWPESKVETHASFLGQVMAQPLLYLVFFIGLVGAPFSDYSLSDDVLVVAGSGAGLRLASAQRPLAPADAAVGAVGSLWLSQCSRHYPGPRRLEVGLPV
jgi:hypothetical protein